MGLINSGVFTASTSTTGTFGPITPIGWSPGQFDASCALQVTVSVTSGSPSLVFKLQGSVDGGNTFVDVLLLPNDTDTAASSFTKSALGTYVYFVAQSPGVRKFGAYQLVVSTATTVTYNASFFEVV